eukprot:TRINITY_DN5575_c0_g2_i1.p1 TRINITY_DN5575_c0_g2~~TRINITY_DN5575_c0_g2_i1.p1  ORF type:complete len:172 (+),score=17.56 TRINITY_DN5575_c0_g2_i1:209-724(+)
MVQNTPCILVGYTAPPDTKGFMGHYEAVIENLHPPAQTIKAAQIYNLFYGYSRKFCSPGQLDTSDSDGTIVAHTCCAEGGSCGSPLLVFSPTGVGVAGIHLGTPKGRNFNTALSFTHMALFHNYITYCSQGLSAGQLKLMRPLIQHFVNKLSKLTENPKISQFVSKLSSFL